MLVVRERASNTQETEKPTPFEADTRSEKASKSTILNQMQHNVYAQEFLTCRDFLAC